MDIIIKPSKISGSVFIPPSKSLTHRYFILASLAKGQSKIINPLMSDDTLHTLHALENLGIKITKLNNDILIEGNNGNFNPINNKLYLGDSGTSARFFIGLSLLSVKPLIIDGSERLRQRPNKELLQALKDQDVDIKYLGLEYHLPIEITGHKFKGGKIIISGKTSSQFISSLLMISAFAENDSEIKIIDRLKSKKYVDLTISAMKYFGVTVINNNYQSFFVKKNQQYKSIDIKVEGDYSSASYFMALSYLLKTPIKIDNLNHHSNQADKIFAEFIKNIETKTEFDISDCPDIALTLGILAPFSNKYLILKGVSSLIAKECDRKKALIDNLTRLGAKLTVGEDYIKIYRSSLKHGEIDTYGDHRVAMSFAILGTVIKDGIIIKNAEVVNKSYPNFFEDLTKIGVKVKKI